MKTLPALFIAALLAGVIVIVGTASGDRKLTTDNLVNASVQNSRLLNFIDHSDGSLEVIDLVSNESVSVFVSGEGSFVRGVMRSLVRERRLRGNTEQAQFELRLTQPGQLLLIDKATDTTLLLDAFGPDNVKTFANLFEPDSNAINRVNTDIAVDKQLARLRSQTKS